MIESEQFMGRHYPFGRTSRQMMLRIRWHTTISAGQGVLIAALVCTAAGVRGGLQAVDLV